MGTTVLKCSNCGANIELDENQETGFCKYCGTKIIREQPNTQKIKVDGKVEIVNNEFESKLALAETNAELYFRNEKRNEYDYQKVIDCFTQAEQAGANESKYYLSLLDFFIRANLDENVIIKNKTEAFIDQCDFFINLAIKNEKNNAIKERIQQDFDNQKEQLIEKFRQKMERASHLQKLHQKKLNKWVLIVWSIPLGIIFLMIIVAFLDTII